jgi:ankyrin repeat protein
MKKVVLLIFALSMQTVYGGAMFAAILQDHSYSYYGVPSAPIASSTTRLHESARKGSRLGIYCQLLLCGCIGRESMNEVDRYGETPLMAAAKHGHPKATKLLIRYGEIVDKTHDNRSSLWYALQHGYLSVAAILINSGARIPFDCIHQLNIRAIRDLCNERNEKIKSIVSSSLPEVCATLIVECLAMEPLLEGRNDNDLLMVLKEEAQNRQKLSLDDFDKSYL